MLINSYVNIKLCHFYFYNQDTVGDKLMASGVNTSEQHHVSLKSKKSLFLVCLHLINVTDIYIISIYFKVDLS